MLTVTHSAKYLLSIFTACVLALANLASAEAADFSLKQNNSQPGIPIVLISGEIKEGDTEKLAALLRSDLQNAYFLTDIWLNSLGGNLNEAKKLGGLIEKLGYTAIVPNGATCASACFFIWVGASARLSPGDLVIHRPYFDMRGASESRAPFEEGYRVTNEAARLYLRQRNVPTSLINEMMRRSSVDGYLVSDADKLAIGPTSPARMEYMVQNCGMPSAGKARRILDNGGLSAQAQQTMRECSLRFYEAQKYEFYFGEDAAAAKDAFVQVQLLAARLRSIDPAAFAIVNRHMRQIINSNQPEVWTSEMMKLFDSVRK